MRKMELSKIGTAFAAAVLVGAVFAAEPPPFFAVSDARKKAPDSHEVRLLAIEPPPPGELRVRPTFCSAGFQFTMPKTEGLKVEYRKVGAMEWRETTDVVPYFPETGTYRGSVMGLEEDTEYELRVEEEGESPAEAQRRGEGVKLAVKFRTWASEVKVGRTVEIDPKMAKFPIVVSDKGTPDGWVRYVLPAGAVLRNETKFPTFIVTNAAYVAIDDMVLRSTCKAREVISVYKSTGVRIRNCDISGWGRVGKSRFDACGRRYEQGVEPHPKKAFWINHDPAISINRGVRESVIERCWIHDSAGHSIAWRYAHPCGPEAVEYRHADHSNVLRYNDLTGSDHHRYNDCVEGGGNFVSDGGFNRDADVYGNFMVFSNDDSIELDGGQQNVRCFGNRFESAHCGVSIQGCIVSPVYVVDNLISGMGDEFGPPGTCIKTSGMSLRTAKESHQFVRDNVFWGQGASFTFMPDSFSHLSGNSYYHIKPYAVSKGAVADPAIVKDAQTSVPLDEAKLDPVYPKRPMGFVLDRARVSDVKESCTITAKSTDGKAHKVSIGKSEYEDWFRVEPSEGTIPADGELKFQVVLDRAKMRDGHDWRAFFLVREKGGLSRPVTIYAQNAEWESPRRVPGVEAVYVDTEGMIAPSDAPKTITLDIPKDGKYYLQIRGKMTNWPKKDYFDAECNKQARITVRVDGGPEECALIYSRNHVTWAHLAPNRAQGNMCRDFDFKAGKHTVTITSDPKSKIDYVFDTIAATEDPTLFEPK